MNPGKGVALDANILIRAVLGQKVRRILKSAVVVARVDFCNQTEFRSEDAKLLYTSFMPHVTLDVLSTFLTASGDNLERAALQAIALEAYREGKLSVAQFRRVLGYHTRSQVHALLKEHGIYLQYSFDDLEHDAKLVMQSLHRLSHDRYCRYKPADKMIALTNSIVPGPDSFKAVSPSCQ